MKLPVFIPLLVLLFYSPAHGQSIAIPFEMAADKGIDVHHLDSIYRSALHDDTTKSVFHRNRADFTKAYQAMLRELGVFLKANDFTWRTQTRCFNRFYFSKEGKIEYLLYSFKPGQLSDDEQKKLQELLNKFIQTDYRFPLTAPENFSQCSPTVFQPDKSK